MDPGMVGRAKKIVLSLSIVVLFALYALQQKQRSPAFVAGQVVTQPPSLARAAPTATRTAAQRVTPTATPPTPAAVVTYPVATSGAADAPTEAPAPTWTPVPTAVETAVAAARSTSGASAGTYKNGTYTGSVADANWGNVQVQVVINNGKISNVQFLEYPNHRSRSQYINEQAMPQLIQEAISAQQANVDVVTGATDTSQAFIESLTAALQQATA